MKPATPIMSPSSRHFPTTTRPPQIHFLPTKIPHPSTSLHHRKQPPRPDKLRSATMVTTVCMVKVGLVRNTMKMSSFVDPIWFRFPCSLDKSCMIILILSSEGKKSMMKVAQRIVSSFCASINPFNGHQWNNISTLDEFQVRATLQKFTDPGQPNGIVIRVASTVWLLVPPQHVFNFLTDEGT